jgi:hypothetical protein
MMDASREIMKELLRARIVGLDKCIESIKTEMKANHQKKDACLGETKACPVKTPTRLEEEESAPEEPKAVAETEEVPEGATDEEAIGVTEDRSGSLRLAVRCCGRLKTRTKRDGPLRQDCAATIGRPTHRFVPALHKGGLRKGPGKKCRSGIKGPGRTLGSRMGGRGLKQQRIKDNVVLGAHKERTRPVFENGIRNQGEENPF